MKEGECSATFVLVVLQKKKDLKNHVVVVHKGKKPFPCIIWDTRAWTAVHEGKKPSKCNICDAGNIFSKLSNKK